MERNLKIIKSILSSLNNSKNIENLVFDNNGMIYDDPNKCNGKTVILGYNQQAIEENNNLKSLETKTGLEKDILDTTDTRHFCIHYFKPQDINNTGTRISTYYFKDRIVIEEAQVGIKGVEPKYSAFKHSFTPDILLFLKHFNKSQNTKNAMAYVKNNAYLFKNQTMDSVNIINKAKEIVDEIIQQNISNINTIQILNEKIIQLQKEQSEQNIINSDTVKKLEQKCFNLETENEGLKYKILEIEKS